MNCCEQNKPYVGCNQGRACPVRASRLNTTDGGHQVNGSLSFPIHRQVLPPEPEEGYTLGLWMVYGLAAAVFITFVVMTWVVYPNFPQ